MGLVSLPSGPVELQATRGSPPAGGTCLDGLLILLGSVFP